MALNPLAKQATDAYKRSTLALRATVVRETLQLWPLFDVSNIDASWEALEVALSALVMSRRRESAEGGAAYLRRFRRLEGISGELDVSLRDAFNRDALLTSLRVTGPVVVKRALRNGVSPEDARKQGLVHVSGSASRIALGGGRDTIADAVAADRKALGWMRVAKPDACYWCAMLASRGPVYKTGSKLATARSKKRAGQTYHDWCGCEMEPVYHQDTEWPGSSRRAEQIWEDSTKGLSPEEARRAFRLAYEASL